MGDTNYSDIAAGGDYRGRAVYEVLLKGSSPKVNRTWVHGYLPDGRYMRYCMPELASRASEVD
eukprot:2120525-Pyramimonas_sp.AAC.1